jgi:sterol desaturase/sphingolipid hydroxylase (fatty acid hydroxylase superfamily)
MTPRVRPVCTSLVRNAVILILLATALGAAIAVVVASGLARADVAETARFSTEWTAMRATIASPWYWAVLATIGVLEVVRPAQREPGRRREVALDLVWLLGAALLSVTVVAVYLAALGDAFDRWIGPGLNLAPALGTALLAALAFVVADLLGYWNHRLHHHVPVLWRFHSVHHSQTRLSALSDRREHVVETFVGVTLVFVPSRLLGLDTVATVQIALVFLCAQAFVHGNIRTNLGPLRHAVISPQAHRVHHAVAPEHHDTNFGIVLSVWDRIFRTGHSDVRLYPATGIEDPRFPHPTSARPDALLHTWLAQVAYPFRRPRGT